MLEHLPAEVSVYEVSPRDGLQNEAAPIPLAGKIELVRALVRAGLRRIELTSYVSPRWVPQLADAEQLIAAVTPAPEGVTWSALVPNATGLERALRVGYSTSKSLGLGLPGVRQLADEFEIVSKMGSGTIVKAKKWKS